MESNPIPNLQPFAAASPGAGLQETERTIAPPPPPRPQIAPALALRFELANAAGATLTRFDVERVLGNNDLVGIDYLARGLAAARPVARLILAGGTGYATGFLIGPRLLMTNRHVFGSAEAARGALAEFGYEMAADGGAPAAEVFRLDPDACFTAGPAEDDLMDFAVVAVQPRTDAGADLARWGYLRLDDRPGKITESEYVTIIQHPSGAHKQVALRENQLVRKEDDRPVLVYRSDTAPGSSGAPCFNDQWQLVALHSRGVPETDAQGRVVLRTGQAFTREELARIPGLRDTDINWVENLGIRVSRIVAQLKSEVEAARKAGAGANPLLGALLEDIARGGPAVEGPPVLARPAPPAAPVAAAMAEEAGRLGRRSRPSARPAPTEPKGYDPAFLPGHVVPLPAPTPAALRFGAAATNRRSGGTAFPYTHFSTIHCAERRLAFVAAVNIDGRKSVPLERGRDRWSYDDRLPEDAQAGDWLYQEDGGNFFDRGHLVRRLDPCWGTPALVQQANDDTFHWTNCAPQHWSFNQGEHLWQGLENYILDNADTDNLLVSVFNGPVFRSDDHVHRGVGIPRDYFKVVAVVKRDGSLAASAYTISQAALVANIDFEDYPVGRFRTFQRPVARVEAMTGLDFGATLRAADVLAKRGIGEQETALEAAEAIELRRLGDIRL